MEFSKTKARRHSTLLKILKGYQSWGNSSILRSVTHSDIGHLALEWLGNT